MPFYIGEIYRYSNQNNSVDRPPEFVDGLPNFFFETYAGPNYSRVFFQNGIHNLAAVKLSDGTKRIPAIIISSSPHKVGTDITPWEDEFDPDHGRIKYYGDNKTSSRRAADSPGNALLLQAFLSYSSPNQDVRRNSAVPLIFLKRVNYDGRRKGNLMFQGFGIIESIELITQYDSKLKNPYFTNYAYTMCVFNMRDEGEAFDWSWINDRRNPELSNEEADAKAPNAWKQWVKEGKTGLHRVRRNVSALKIIPEAEQKPVAGSKEYQLLLNIYDYYKNKRHIFELLAMRVTQEIFEEAGTAFIPGWITQKSGDRGIDFVARLDFSSHMSALKIVILGQAKCEKPNVPTNGVHIARTVARLKRGWFGVYVTTSFFSKSVQLEVMDDQYPIMLICGKKLAETVGKILFKRGISLEDFLEELDQTYCSENRRPDDILSF